jgi:hypothetical protein
MTTIPKIPIDGTFTLYVGRGKGGHAKTGKPRYIFYDMSGTGADHDRLDEILIKIHTANKDKTYMPQKEFINHTRRAIASLACQKGAIAEGFMTVTCFGQELRFNVVQYCDPDEILKRIYAEDQL